MVGRKMVREGFTLIELLVVIAIIAILAAILFPVFSRAREKGRQAQCTSNFKNMSNALLMYSSDYDERFPLRNGGRGLVNWWVQPPGATPNFFFDGNTQAQRAVYSHNAIMPYLKNWQVLACPSGKQLVDFAPYSNTPNPVAMSLMMNALLGSVPQSQVVAPARCILIWEPWGDVAWKVETVTSPDISGNPPGTTAPFRYVPPTTAPFACGSTCVIYGGIGGTPYGTVRPNVQHHSGGELYAYVDGHVKWAKGCNTGGSADNTVVWAACNPDGTPVSYWWDGCCPWSFRPIVQ